jgi:hypothetical protein
MDIAFFTVMVTLWLAFAGLLVASPATLEGTWRSVRALPLPVEAIVWLLFLPWMLGLAVWESRRRMSVRLLAVAVLAAGFVLVSFPRGF